MKRARTFALFAGLMLAAAPLPARAGPPLLCFPYQIGDAKSLPWGKDAFAVSSTYDHKRVVEDTLGILKAQRDTLVRMETLRRAAIYLKGDAPRATELLAKISWVAMDAEAAGKPSAEAWFAAGFLAATLRQNGVDVRWHPGVEQGADGYAWVRRAVELTPDDPAMQFGAALVLFEHGDHKVHLRRAVEGAKPGTPLAKSIESNHAFGARSLADLRAELNTGKPARADGKPGK